MLMGKTPFGIDQGACLQVATGLLQLRQAGVQLAVVLGGGNICRGVQLSSLGMAQTPADQIGMLATLMNGLALENALRALGCEVALMSALDCPQVAASYTWRRATAHLARGELLLFVGGTGHPYFTTDTAAALRACEIEADLLMKATNVDGVYAADPRLHPELSKYDTISYSQVLAQKLGVMDASSIAMCRDRHLPILVFNKSSLLSDDFLSLIAEGKVGTLIHGD